MQLKVIDISSWQHPNGQPIDWHAVAESGVQGVIVKATQGAWYVNPFFADDVKDAEAAGLLVGAYHFAEPGRSTPDVQAAFHHEHIRGLHLPLGTWLDLEVMDGLGWHELAPWADGYMAAIDTPQVPAGLYEDVDFANAMINTSSVKRLWLANPSDIQVTFKPYMVQTGRGEVKGIVGAVDLDTVVNARGLNPPDGGANPLPAPTPVAPAQPSDGQHPVLNQGATGNAVERLQQVLNDKGAGLTVDGNFGPRTHAAVVLFQSENGLTVDGVVGPQTWTALENTTAVHLPTTIEHLPQISQGVRGPLVTYLQRLLNETGAHLVVDGDFGPVTLATVADFQTAHGLLRDGIVGPLTWAALISAT